MESRIPTPFSNNDFKLLNEAPLKIIFRIAKDMSSLTDGAAYNLSDIGGPDPLKDRKGYTKMLIEMEKSPTGQFMYANAWHSKLDAIIEECSKGNSPLMVMGYTQSVGSNPEKYFNNKTFPKIGRINVEDQGNLVAKPFDKDTAKSFVMEYMREAIEKIQKNTISLQAIDHTLSSQSSPDKGPPENQPPSGLTPTRW